jgi:hypothetical protein
MNVMKGLFDTPPAAEPQESAGAAQNFNDIEALKGGIAVITGGASGIGLAVAHEALQHGLHVAIGDIEQAALDAALPELRAAAAAGLGVEGYQCDVTDAASCDRFASSVASEASFGGASVSLLHCNAGVAAGQVRNTLRVPPCEKMKINFQDTLGTTIMQCFSKPKGVRLRSERVERHCGRLVVHIQRECLRRGQHLALVRAVDGGAWCTGCDRHHLLDCGSYGGRWPVWREQARLHGAHSLCTTFENVCLVEMCWVFCKDKLGTDGSKHQICWDRRL